MQNQTVPTDKNDAIFSYLFFLTLFFLLLEISFFIQSNQVYLAGFAEVSQQLKIPISIIPAIIFFIAAQLLLHFTFCCFIWMLAKGVITVLQIPRKKQLGFAIAMWLAALVLCLVANQLYYPHSKFAALTAFFFPQTFAMLIFFLLLAFFTLTILITFLKISLLSKYKFIFLGSIFFILAMNLFFILMPSTFVNKTNASVMKPNVIIIGIDSLRPDFLSFFGAENKTPFFDEFLQQATNFADATTPLARTFPTWASILTGQHPKQISIRSDLASQAKINFNDALPTILQQQGYETFFATDESRFSNIDHDFGFDHIIAPPMGLNDFLIGTINDFPLSNLVLNTVIGKWLFPYSYANRGVYFTYQPQSFLNLLRSGLAQRTAKPLFIAIHFCLPHFPYLWADAPQTENVTARYQASISRADTQVSDFFSLLKQQGLLQHAIVVLLSDHGEALELAGDRVTEEELYTEKKSPVKFYPPSLDDEAMNRSAGHGTDVLGLSQYHTLLSFRLFGPATQFVGNIAGPVSINQIKATILELLHLTKRDHDEPSLLQPLLQGIPLHKRHLFLESDFSPASIRTVYPEIHQVLLDGIQLFEINPINHRLVLKHDMEQMVINSKQYADIYGHWALALYPQQKNFYLPILINLLDGRWSDDLSSSFATASPAAKMLEALRSFYGAEIKNVMTGYSQTH